MYERSLFENGLTDLADFVCYVRNCQDKVSMKKNFLKNYRETW